MLKLMNSYLKIDFRSKRNTKAAATILVDSVRKNIGLGKLTGVILLTSARHLIGKATARASIAFQTMVYVM